MKLNIKTLILLVAASTSSVANSAPQQILPDGYAIETIETPPKTEMHIAGLDTAKNGDVYVATRFGDVWKYSQSAWSKFAEGLHEPAGLLCENDGSILVTQKPELTRLVDLDNDGIADDYINVANDWKFHNNYHEFHFGPVKDKYGNYFGTLNLSHGDPDAFKLKSNMGSSGGYRGWVYKVTSQGEFIPYASGLRSPAGLGLNPQGELFYTDNQGDWVGTSKLHLIEEGKFYGHPISLIEHPDYGPDKVRAMTAAEFDAIREQPNVLFPHQEISNSPGNPDWDVSEGKFGPFKGQMFFGDQSKANIFRVMLDKVQGKYQGAVIEFVSGMQSGNIRVDFDNKGQLWVGQTARGWSSAGSKPFGLQKIVWDGTNPFELLDMKLTKTGFKLNFTEALDVGSVNVNNIKVREWNYLYHQTYGSPKVNEKSLNISDLTLSKDKKSIEFSIPLTADKVVMVDFTGLTSQTSRGSAFTKVYYTLNNLK
ncbi:PQQ-dependent sugar dehydrogenase [Paraglaciecola aquimarina]|uniref:PQQ-dependent sugar dehydrogenase n=1 Tax=Paraglaciecola aquimarina TaxID=1235557 RepID=A0ABU3STS6_9ALTE|nr:PQQ-dependent sugar dehydrogenase [Paraglaciecola aquimarina]MDU0353408.1 PQQ-dependent sugar dehydrogenase [Paraglaciecola aquimarina]